MNDSCDLPGWNPQLTKHEVWELVQQEQKRHFLYKVPTIIFLLVLMAVGVPGNVMVLRVYGTRFPPSTTKNFIMAIAMFDLTSCVAGMPFEIYELVYTMGLELIAVCKTYRFFGHLFALSSAFVLVDVSVDRFHRICRPFHKQMTIRGSTIMIGATSFLALVLSLPSVFLYGGHVQVIHGVELYDCEINDNKENEYLVNLYNYVLFFFWLVCFIILFVMYGFITYKLYVHEQRQEVYTQQQISQDTELMPDVDGNVTGSGHRENLDVDGNMTDNQHRQELDVNGNTTDNRHALWATDMLQSTGIGDDNIDRAGQGDECAAPCTDTDSANIVMSNNIKVEQRDDSLGASVGSLPDTCEESGGCWTADISNDGLVRQSHPVLNDNVAIFQHRYEPPYTSLDDSVRTSHGLSSIDGSLRPQLAINALLEWRSESLTCLVRGQSTGHSSRHHRRRRHRCCCCCCCGCRGYCSLSGRSLSLYSVKCVASLDRIHMVPCQSCPRFQHIVRCQSCPIFKHMVRCRACPRLEQHQGTPDASHGQNMSTGGQSTGGQATDQTLQPNGGNDIQGCTSGVTVTFVDSDDSTGGKGSRPRKCKSPAAGSSLRDSLSVLTWRFVQRRNKKSYKVSIMMLMVTIGFVLSYLPHLAWQLFKALSHDTFHELLCSHNIYYALNHLLLKSFYINSAINPIIYSFYNKSFRDRCCRVVKQPSNVFNPSGSQCSSAPSFLRE